MLANSYRTYDEFFMCYLLMSEQLSEAEPESKFQVQAKVVSSVHLQLKAIEQRKIYAG